MEPIETYIAVRAAELNTALGRLDDALYWANTALEEARRVRERPGAGGGFQMSNDLNLTVAEVRMRRQALADALKLGAAELTDERIEQLLSVAGIGMSQVQS